MKMEMTKDTAEPKSGSEKHKMTSEEITERDIRRYKEMEIIGITVGTSKVLPLDEQVKLMKALFPEKFD